MSDILILDDEQGMRSFLKVMLEKEGYAVTLSDSVQSGMDAIKKNAFDLVVSDLRLTDGSGIDFLKQAREIAPHMFCIIITAYATLETALEAIKLGASDYILKPFKIETLRGAIKNALEKKRLFDENQYLRNAIGGTNEYENITFHDEKMKKLLEVAEKAAKSDANIFITGESGSGKERFARHIHARSLRCNGPFVGVNCGALPETLLESELFGYVSGAFTGANKNKDGLFVVANKGTIFLDEISETSNAFQVKLLRVIQERELRPLGSSNVKKIDVRIIAATNKSTEESLKKGELREDLYYRLNVIPIHILPLRERPADVPFLADYFIAQYSNGHKKLSAAAHTALLTYPFPGNVRELENIIERVCVLSSNHVVTDEDFAFLHGQRECSVAHPLRPLADVDREHILSVLSLCDNNKSKASHILGVSRKYIYQKLKDYGIDDA